MRNVRTDGMPRQTQRWSGSTWQHSEGNREESSNVREDSNPFPSLALSLRLSNTRVEDGVGGDSLPLTQNRLQKSETGNRYDSFASTAERSTSPWPGCVALGPGWSFPKSPHCACPCSDLCSILPCTFAAFFQIFDAPNIRL